jgi:predicted ferric reductase
MTIPITRRTPPQDGYDHRLRGGRRLTQPEREYAVLVVIALTALAVVAMWWADTPAGSLHTFADRLTAAGRITGLVGTYLILVQVVLMARLPWLDRWVGSDRLSAWHRANGQYTIALIVAHTLFIIWGYAAFDHVALSTEAAKLIEHYPDVLAATAGLGLLVMVAVTSVRAARRRLRYETWYLLHLYTYLAIALSFSHQLATGNEFITHPLSRVLWVALYVATFGLLVAFRVVVPVRDALRYQLRVAEVRPESADAVSVYLTGRNLARMNAHSGQFFRWRFLDRQSWWQSHPFSLSVAPNPNWLRITAKGVGDHSQALRRLRPGTRVIAEGPYGSLTARRRSRRRVLLVAGGVGITPLRALFEDLTGRPGDVTLLYRATDEHDVLFAGELERLADARGFDVYYLLGRRRSRKDPLAPRRLLQLVPDIAERDVYLCGPPGMMDQAIQNLRSLGVGRSQIHQERFEL